MVRRTPSNEPKTSRCANPTLVMIPYSGRTILANSRIIPKWQAAISITAISCSGFKLSKVRDAPKVEFSFSCVETCLYLVESTAVTNSFVVVLPHVPVMPITGVFNIW